MKRERKNPTSIFFFLPFSTGCLSCLCRHQAAYGLTCPESANTLCCSSAVCLSPPCPAWQSIYPLTLHLWSCFMDPPLWRRSFCSYFLIFSMPLISTSPGYLSVLFLKLLFPRSLTHILFQLFPTFLITLSTEINFMTLSFGTLFQICKYEVRLANACLKYRTLIIGNFFLD